MTEAERLLHKTSGGLSLFDRLERDPELLCTTDGYRKQDRRNGGS